MAARVVLGNVVVPQLHTADSVTADLVDWRALMPSKHALDFLASPPRHTLVRPKHFDRLPLDCIVLVFAFLPKRDLMFFASHVCTAWARVARSRALWCQFSLTTLAETSELPVGRRAPEDRRAFWLEQLMAGRFQALSVVDVRGADLHHRDVTRIMRAAPQLQELELSHSKLDDACLAALAESSPCTPRSEFGAATLTALRFNFVTTVNGHTLSTLCERLPQLQELELCGCSQLRDNDFNRMLRALPHLTHFKARNTAITAAAFDGVYLPALGRLHVALCAGFNDDGLKRLAACAPNLEALDIASCPVTDDGVVAFADAAPASCRSSLVFFAADGCCALTDTSIRRVAGTFRRLISVAVDRSRVAGGGLREVLELPRLVRLSCSACLHARRDVGMSADLRRLCTARRAVLTAASAELFGLRAPASQRPARRLSSLVHNT